MTSLPIVCTTSPELAGVQLRSWATLVPQATSVSQCENGVSLVLPGSLHDDVADLVAKETACCAWATWSLRRIDQSIQVDVTSDQDDGVATIVVMFAEFSKRSVTIRIPQDTLNDSEQQQIAELA
jgi:hypothetical protein